MTSFRIALRYLTGKKSHSSVNIISLISVAGVGVATSAIVIVLSVFNGFTRLASEQMNHLDPSLRIVPAQGKAIANADSIAEILSGVDSISGAVPMIEERGLLESGGRQAPVIFQAVGNGYEKIVPLGDITVAGEVLEDENELYAPMSPGAGVANHFALVPSYDSYATLYVPRRTGRVNPANPAAAYKAANFTVTGVVQSGKMDFDSEKVLIPLSTARNMLEYTTEATNIEIAASPGADIADLAENVRAKLGNLPVKVLTRQELQSESFHMIAVEKWVTFAMLSMIMIVAAFNIFSTVALLISEKRHNMETLRMLGAPADYAGRVFAWEGMLITLLGGVIGTAAGVLLSLGQQSFGWIKLNGDASALVTDSYPVAVHAGDILAVLGLVAATSLLSSGVAAYLARTKK